jgi:hypothetical protein
VEKSLRHRIYCGKKFETFFSGVSFFFCAQLFFCALTLHFFSFFFSNFLLNVIHNDKLQPGGPVFHLGPENDRQNLTKF